MTDISLNIWFIDWYWKINHTKKKPVIYYEGLRAEVEKNGSILFGNNEYRVLLFNDADRETKDNVHLLMAWILRRVYS